jgi:hypothetical protein
MLMQLHVSKINIQWVNIGSGIWYVDFNINYPEVDASLLSGFTVQTFGEIGSIFVDSILLIKKDSLLELTNSPNTYYYTSNRVYVCLSFYDNPILHDVFLNILFGYSFNDIKPINSETIYEGRLSQVPDITISRDPLYFGKIQYNGVTLSLHNEDGNFNNFLETSGIFGGGNLYGNIVRILFGYDDINIDDYICVFSGKVEKTSLSEEQFIINGEDSRKFLTKSAIYKCTNKNALEAIQELLLNNYAINYDSIFYNTTAWEVAKALVNNITIDMEESEEESPVIDIIENICSTVFGLFILETDNKVSFKIVDTTATASTTILDSDILSNHYISFDPTEVISSAKVGYNKDWTLGYDSPYTFVYNTNYESTVFQTYKIYNQKTFFTLLTNSTDATAFGETILQYAKDIHGIGEVLVPMSYYTLTLGDIVNIEIKKLDGEDMLGTKKCEIISKSYKLNENGFINFGYRIV